MTIDDRLRRGMDALATEVEPGHAFSAEVGARARRRRRTRAAVRGGAAVALLGLVGAGGLFFLRDDEEIIDPITTLPTTVTEPTLPAQTTTAQTSTAPTTVPPTSTGTPTTAPPDVLPDTFVGGFDLGVAEFDATTGARIEQVVEPQPGGGFFNFRRASDSIWAIQGDGTCANHIQKLGDTTFVSPSAGSVMVQFTIDADGVNLAYVEMGCNDLSRRLVVLDLAEGGRRTIAVPDAPPEIMDLAFSRAGALLVTLRGSQGSSRHVVRLDPATATDVLAGASLVDTWANGCDLAFPRPFPDGSIAVLGCVAGDPDRFGATVVSPDGTPVAWFEIPVSQPGHMVDYVNSFSLTADGAALIQIAGEDAPFATYLWDGASLVEIETDAIAPVW